MKLTKVEIEAFRSIRKCQTLHIDPTVTVLIGANDHGKTNLLEAIRCLNSDRPFTEKDKNWDTDDPSKVKASYYFTLDPDEITRIVGMLEAEHRKPPADGAKPADETRTETVFNAPSDLEKWILVRSGVGGRYAWIEPAGVFKDKAIVDFINSRLPRVELFEPVASNIKDSISLIESAS